MKIKRQRMESISIVAFFSVFCLLEYITGMSLILFIPVIIILIKDIRSYIIIDENKITYCNGFKKKTIDIKEVKRIEMLKQNDRNYWIYALDQFGNRLFYFKSNYTNAYSFEKKLKIH